MTNIFMISPRLGDEDRFTSHWHYMLENNHEIGQQVFNHISQRAGLAKSRFERCEDHPMATRVDKPDFLLKGSDYDILCEHKLESPLGPQQLERYLKLASKANNKTYLALVANQSGISISREVLSDNNYLKPKKSDHPYYLWQDFQPVFKQHESPMTGEFIDYMISLGMEPWQFGKWDDPFIDAASADQFRQLWQPVKSWFKAPERKQPRNLVRPDRVGLGCQVQKPLWGVHLIYFEVSKSRIAQARDCGSHPFKGRGVYMRVYLNKNNEAGIKILPVVNALPPSGGFEISASTPEDPFIDKRGIYCAREYAITLTSLLANDLARTKDNMIKFVSLATDHLQKGIDRQRAKTGINP